MENKSLLLSMFFKKALINILENNTGIIISVDNEIKPLYPGIDKIVIYKLNDNIKIMDYDGDLVDGETISIEFKD